MRFKKFIFYLFYLISAAYIIAPAVFPAAAENNIALECKIDSFCGQTGENEAASMLVDDDEHYKTKWCAADGNSHSGEPHWIIVDFESVKTFDRVRLVKASEGEEDYGIEAFDANSFTFWASNDKINWIKILEVTKDGGNPIYEGQFPGEPVNARYLKLTVERPEQSDGSDENQAVRLYDLKVREAEIPEILEVSASEEIITEITEDIPPQLMIAPDVSDSVNSIMILIVMTVLSGISTVYILKRARK